MSDLFAMTDESADPKLAQAQANSVDSLSEIDSPLFRGSLKGLGLGVMRGFAKVADTVGLALAPFANAPAPSYLTGSGSFQRVAESPELTDPIYKAIDDTTGKAVDYWTPRANEVGRVGQVLGGLGEAGSELVAGAGTPYALVAANTVEGGKQLVDQGVDAKTAGAAAALEGAASYAGLKIPIAGSTLLSRIATGAAGNVLLGSGTRAAEKKLLESQGYTDQAQPFTTDATAVSMDALLGALFGATHHALSPRIDPRLTPSQSDAILTARNAKNFQQETAPGTPADVRASVAHQDAMEAALEQLSRGEPVDVGDQVAQHQGAQFEPAGKFEQSAELARQVEEEAPSDPGYVVEEHAQPESVQSEAAPAPSDYSVAEGDLTDEQRVQFERLRSGAESGSPELGRTAAGGPPAVGWREATRILGKVSADGGREPLTVYRGGEREVEQGHFTAAALGDKTGHPSSGLGVFFTTSKGEAARYGRTRPAQLDIRNPKVIKNEDLPGFDSAADAAAFSQKLAGEGYDGIIIKNRHLGPGAHDWIVAFKPEQVIHEAPARELVATAKPAQEPVARPMAEAAPGAPGSGPVEAPASAAAEPKGGADEPPELASIRQLAAERPNAPVIMGYDEDGNPVKSTLAAESERIQREYARDIEDTKAYEAAINCYLGHGA